jgi:hypothetical protein
MMQKNYGRGIAIIVFWRKIMTAINFLNVFQEETGRQVIEFQTLLSCVKGFTFPEYSIVHVVGPTTHIVLTKVGM